MEGQWFFSTHMAEPLVQFFHPEIHIWMNMDHKAYMQVGAYDLNLNVGYVIHRLGERHDAVGQKRIFPDGLEKKLSFRNVYYMTYEDREAMRLLLEKAFSYRGRPIPIDSASYWDQGLSTVQNLRIINSGKLVSPELAKFEESLARWNERT